MDVINIANIFKDLFREKMHLLSQIRGHQTLRLVATLYEALRQYLMFLEISNVIPDQNTKLLIKKHCAYVGKYLMANPEQDYKQAYRIRERAYGYQYLEILQRNRQYLMMVATWALISLRNMVLLE